MLGTLILGLVVAAAILFVWRGRRKRRLMNKIPEPSVSLPFFGVTFEMWPFDEFTEKARKWAMELGPVFYLKAPGLHSVYVTGPNEIQSILSSHENIKKGFTYQFLNEWLATGLLTGSGDKWRSRRKLLQPVFSYKVLENFIPIFNANSAIFVDILKKRVVDDYVEIDELISLLTLDIICETVMGTALNVQKGERVPYIQAVKRMCELFVYRACSPWFFPNFMWKLSSLSREEKGVLKILNDFSNKVIKEKRSNYERRKLVQENHDSGNKKPLSFLDLLLEVSDGENHLTDDDIKEETNTFLFAGHDTTAAALCWAIYLIGAHQDVQDNIVSELSDIFGSDDRQPTPADLNKMAYLDQVMKEALRLYPSVPLYVRSVEKDIQLGDYLIPDGMNIMISAFVLHKNPEIYPDPNKFDPNRFSPEQVSGRHPYAFIPFSSGPRNCIGQKFARLEEKCVLSAILRHFKIVSVDKEVLPIPDVVLKPKTPIKIKLFPRL